LVRWRIFGDWPRGWGVRAQAFPEEFCPPQALLSGPTGRDGPRIFGRCRAGPGAASQPPWPVGPRRIKGPTQSLASRLGTLSPAGPRGPLIFAFPPHPSARGPGRRAPQRGPRGGESVGRFLPRARPRHRSQGPRLRIPPSRHLNYVPIGLILNFKAPGPAAYFKKALRLAARTKFRAPGLPGPFPAKPTFPPPAGLAIFQSPQSVFGVMDPAWCTEAMGRFPLSVRIGPKTTARQPGFFVRLRFGTCALSVNMAPGGSVFSPLSPSPCSPPIPGPKTPHRPCLYGDRCNTGDHTGARGRLTESSFSGWILGLVPPRPPRAARPVYCPLDENSESLGNRAPIV